MNIMAELGSSRHQLCTKKNDQNSQQYDEHKLEAKTNLFLRLPLLRFPSLTLPHIIITQAVIPSPGKNGDPANGLPIAKLSLMLLVLADMISELAILGILIGAGLSGNLTSPSSRSSCSTNKGYTSSWEMRDSQIGHFYDSWLIK